MENDKMNTTVHTIPKSKLFEGLRSFENKLEFVCWIPKGLFRRIGVLRSLFISILINSSVLIPFEPTWYYVYILMYM